MKIEGLPVIDVEESEQITVAVRADDLLEGDTANPQQHPIAIALRRQDDADDARVTKNETLVRRGKQWFRSLIQAIAKNTGAMNGSLQLFEYPGDIVRLSCPKCGRSGQYRKQTLIERYGADVRLPDLREEITQCSRQGKMHDGCMVRYVDLVAH